MSTLFRRSPKIIFNLDRSHNLLKPGLLDEDWCPIVDLFEGEEDCQDVGDGVFHITGTVFGVQCFWDILMSDQELVR